jgi:hypothetical protein
MGLSFEFLMARTAKQRTPKLPVTSSVAAQLPRKQEALFCEVLSLFEKEGLPYTVSGAFALRQHTGISRHTKDLDIFLKARDISRALSSLEEKGLHCEIRDPAWLAKTSRDGYFVDLIAGMSNGAIRVDESWIDRSYPATIVGVRTRVSAPEELVASKLFVTRRERFDGSDIAHVIYVSRGKLQWERIMQLAGEHWELVLWNLVLFLYIYPANSDFIPKAVWQDLLSRFAKEIRSPNPDAKFRGSLIDHRMFAIDVKEWGLDDLLRENRSRIAQIRSLPRTRRRAS